MHSFAVLLALGAAVIAPVVATGDHHHTTKPPPHPTGCPTITATTHQCRTCAVPACLVLSTVTQNCGCPNPPATSYTAFPCHEQCKGLGCETSWAVVEATGCTPSTSTPPPSSSSSSSSITSSPPPPSSSSEDCDSTTVTIPPTSHTKTKTSTYSPPPSSSETDSEPPCETSTSTSSPPPPSSSTEDCDSTTRDGQRAAMRH
ncbi:hypothetical protein B0I37DRAFT_89211 [Chaetomium sp. MPI-CAGE-AT-0009]|nr:hypothetical protein B0I37DRAFT_89211 [Chaetomium sp. MPI-CAGE-AT-0009]